MAQNVTFVSGNIAHSLAHARTHILKSINISLRVIAWPVFFLSVYFLIWSFTNFVQQYPSVHLINIEISFSTLFCTVAVALLCITNWWLESVKWKLIVNRVTPCSFKTAAHSVLMGCSFGFITPNRIGDYAGRTIPFENEIKPNIVALNLINGFSQFLAVSVAGLVCLFFYSHHLSLFSVPVIIAACIMFVLVTALFMGIALIPQRLSQIIQKTGLKNRYISKALELPRFPAGQMLQVMGISLLRATVFIIQLVLVIVIFSDHANIFPTVAAAGVYFVVLTISPSLVFNKLGLREALSVLILAPVTGSPVIAALAVFVLWFVNQVIPVLLGSLLLIKRSVQQA